MTAAPKLPNLEFMPKEVREKITPPGIYFGMPDSEYHADPSLSNSGIKSLLVSALDFWTESPINPDWEDRETPAARECGLPLGPILVGRRLALAAVGFMLGQLQPDDVRRLSGA